MLDKVVKDALSLSLSDRSILTRFLLRTLESDAPDETVEIEDAWKKEIENRVDVLLAGRIKTIPAEEVFAELRGKQG